MKHYSTYCLSLWFSIVFLLNAVQITFGQNNTQAVQQCIAADATSPESLKNNFDIARWAKDLQAACDRMVSSVTSERVEDIALQREAVNTLAKLANSCPALKPVKANLDKIQKIYAEKIKEKTQSSNNNIFESEGNKTYLMSLDDAKEIKKNIEAVIKKLKL